LCLSGKKIKGGLRVIIDRPEVTKINYSIKGGKPGARKRKERQQKNSLEEGLGPGNTQK